jgi:phosphoesterase RecJ-like protein
MESYVHKQIHDLLLTARKPVFISDERIDGDSLGASLALAEYMKGRGVTVPVYVSEPVPEKYRFLPNSDLCTHDLAVLQEEGIDLVVVFDCSDALYVDRLLAHVPGHPKVVNIDHHTTNSRYGDVNQVIVESPATAEVIHQFFKANHIIPTKDAAICLLTGICFDTTIFSNGATNERAFKAASELLLSGARVQDVIRTMFSNRSVSALRVWGSALERLYSHPGMDFVSTCFVRKDIEEHGVSEEELEGLSNFLNLVTDAPLLMVLRETKEGDVKISMRSTGRDISRFAKIYGGGGHAKAAGFTVKNATLVCDQGGCWKVVRNKKK